MESSLRPERTGCERCYQGYRHMVSRRRKSSAVQTESRKVRDRMVVARRAHIEPHYELPKLVIFRASGTWKIYHSDLRHVQ
jgi:hypothetical protein